MVNHVSGYTTIKFVNSLKAGDLSSGFSSNSGAFALELVVHLEDMLPQNDVK